MTSPLSSTSQQEKVILQTESRTVPKSKYADYFQEFPIVERNQILKEADWLGNHPVLMDRVFEVADLLVNSTDPMPYETAQKVETALNTLSLLGRLKNWAGEEAVKLALDIDDSELTTLFKALDLFDFNPSRLDSFKRLVAMQKNNELTSLIEHASQFFVVNRFILLYVSWEKLKSHPNSDRFNSKFLINVLQKVATFYHSIALNEDEYKYLQHVEFVSNSYIDYYTSDLSSRESLKTFQEKLKAKLISLSSPAEIAVSQEADDDDDDLYAMPKNPLVKTQIDRM